MLLSYADDHSEGNNDVLVKPLSLTGGSPQDKPIKVEEHIKARYEFTYVASKEEKA